MPDRGRYRLAAVAGLAREYAFASAAVRRRVMKQAERLVESIDPSQAYPRDFVVFRLSGYRPAEAGELLDGSSLLADLPQLVLAFSKAMPLDADERPGGSVPLAAVPAETGISRRTLHRWRKQGLCCHWVQRGGEVELACFREALSRHRERLAAAGGRRGQILRRLDPPERQAIRKAFAAAIDAGETPTAAARRVAERFRRSIDAVRRACVDLAPRRRHRLDRDRFARLLQRAAASLVSPQEIARRHGRSGEAVARMLRSLRADRLRRLILPRRRFPTFDRPDAGSVLLASDSATGGFAEAWFAAGPLEVLLAEVEAADPEEGCGRAEEILAIEAWIVNGAADGIALLGGAVREAALDGIETKLRKAVRLRQRVCRRLLPLMVSRIEQHLGLPLRSRTVPEIVGLLDLSMATAAEVLDRFEAPRGRDRRSLRQPSLRGVLTLALDPRLQSACAGLTATRAAARHRDASLRWSDPRLRIASWAAVVDAASKWRDGVVRLSDEDRRLLEVRHGWGDGPPQTTAEMAKREGLLEPRLRHRLQAAQDLLRAAVRAERPGR